MWFWLTEFLAIGGFSYVLFKSRFLIVGWFSQLESNTREVSQKHTTDNLNILLPATGLGRIQSENWINRRWTILKITFFIGCSTSLITGEWMWIFSPLVYVGAQYYLLIKEVRTRKEKILKRIPFILDMLTLNLQSGLDFVSSLEELVDMHDAHPLRDEIRLTLQAIHVGETRSSAFKNLGQRTQVPELANLATVIQQTETMGSSLTELLKMQSNEIRHRIFKNAEAQAQKAPVKILIPMMLCIFPIVFILLFVPIGIELFNNFH